MDADPDLQLVKRCQSGDISAFDSLVRRHKDRIYRLVYRMLDGGSEVDDAAQEIFFRAYRRMGGFHCRSSFSTWLTRIAVNYCINCLRSQRNFRFFPMGMFSHGDQRRSSVEPQSAAERTEKCEKLYQAINSLSPKQRAVVVLHYFEDNSYEEISGILNCSIGTVKSRLFHARRKLRERLEPYLKDDECIDTGSEGGGEDYEMLKM